MFKKALIQMLIQENVPKLIVYGTLFAGLWLLVSTLLMIP